METTKTTYRITATYDDNGNRCHCDRAYALGEHANATFATREEAQNIVDDLRQDVGDVVDASVEYEIVEV